MCVGSFPLGWKVLIRFRDGRPSCGSAVIGNLLCGKHTVLNLVRSLCNQFSTTPAINIHPDSVRGSSRDVVSSWHRSNHGNSFQALEGF